MRDSRSQLGVTHEPLQEAGGPTFRFGVVPSTHLPAASGNTRTDTNAPWVSLESPHQRQPKTAVNQYQEEDIGHTGSTISTMLGSPASPLT